MRLFGKRREARFRRYTAGWHDGFARSAPEAFDTHYIDGWWDGRADRSLQPFVDSEVDAVVKERGL